ncbi:hypothetical protein [Mesorhizobium kowhaii]|uniref:Uncharacterized protein n=1 Tax=Mesorhizobium kowhaii TaxID=1300272 RepID=A0A2W7BU45_9HYPH|nr:hypothetical protein [Mesorhizobium kowhaii]PZV34390.1 hypothetical protein B5V02_33165 [Mesorhizobium kowhaii]
MAGKNWTFQSLIDSKMTVTASCQNSACYHSHKLDLTKLRDRFGPDAPAMEWDIRPRLRCNKCNGNDVSLTYTPDTSPTYGKTKGS